MYMYSYMFKLQSPSQYSPFDAIHLSRHFFHCSKQFLNMLTLIPFSASANFYFTSSISAKHFLLRTFFIWGNKKEVAWGEIRWIGTVGHRGHAIFGQKLLNTQHGVSRCACKSSIMKWANVLSLQKKSLKPNTASHTTTSWCTDTDELLEHSPIGEACITGSPPSRR